MKLDISDLKSRNNKTEKVSLVLDEKGFFDGSEEINYLEPPKFDGLVSISGDIIDLEGKVTAKVELSCSRCLEKFPYVVEIHIHESFTNSLEGHSDEVALIKDDAIDINKVIENNIIIQLPIKRLCRENCKGLCQKCGANLNASQCNCETEVDPRLAKLKDFLSTN